MDDAWVAVDDYFLTLTGEDDALRAALRAASAAGLPEIQVSATQGRLLQLLARTVGATRILEVGTLAGYSAIWLGRALAPGGSMVTLELDPRHAAVAEANLAAAGLADVVRVRVGAALESLAALVAEGAGPFDLVFIDADKANIPSYVELSLALARPGSLIVVDNVVRAGKVVDATSEDPNVLGVRAMVDAAARDPRLEGTAIQTVGVKGYDGFALFRVLDAATSA